MSQPSDTWTYLQTYVEQPATPPETPEGQVREEPQNPGLPQVVADRSRNFVAAINAHAVKIPSPGGIGALLVILLTLVLVLIPVGGMGETRLNLLYDVLRGARGLPLPITSNGTSQSPGAVVGPLSPSGGGGGGGGGWVAPWDPFPLPLGPGDFPLIPLFSEVPAV